MTTPAPEITEVSPEEVLRYWLAALRQEEALSARIKAQSPTSHPIDLHTGRADVNYAVLRSKSVIGAEDAADAENTLAAALLQRGPAVDFEVAPTFARFLEHCASERRRMTRDQRKRTGRAGVADAPHEVFRVGFPVLHDPRRGTLTAVLSFPVASPVWRKEDGSAWSFPDAGGRSASGVPAQVTLVDPLPAPEGDDDGPVRELPCDLNRGAFSLLGILDTHVDRLQAQLMLTPDLQPAQIVAAASALIRFGRDAARPEGGDDEDGDGDGWPGAAISAALSRSAAQSSAPRALLAELAAATRLAVSGRYNTDVHDTSIIWRASGSPTAQLQRELETLLGERVPADGPLARYLRGALGDPTDVTADAAAEPPTGAVAPGTPLLGLRKPRALTEDQRRVGERALHDVLTCASGPPGTGKTELILNLAGHTIIEATARLAGGEKPGRPMVVTSTNNRAVVNVLEGLANPGGLPLVLRAGSQLVLGDDTRRVLGEARDWLGRRSEPVSAASATLAARGGELRRRIAEVREAARWPLRRAEALAALPALQAALTALEATAERVKAHASAAAEDSPASELRDALEGVAAWARARGGGMTAPLESPGRILWRGGLRNRMVSLAPKAAEHGVELPDISRYPTEGLPFDALADALEELALGLTEGQRLPRLEPGDKAYARDPERIETERSRLAAEIARHAAVPAEPPAPPSVAEAHGLFALACEVREAWASAHRHELLAVLTELIGLLEDKVGTFKSHLNQEPDARGWLLSLFPVMGCTLLSLGNMFPDIHAGIGLAVIDEAGQCHPAHAVAALARARRALVLGDVHQNTPILQLEEPDERRLLARTFPNRAALPLGAAMAPARVTRSAVTSAQHLAARATREPLALMTHFRCAPEIIAVSDRLCGYGLAIRTPTQPPLGGLPGPLVLHDLRTLQQRRDASWHNPAEAEAVAERVARLIQAGVRPGQIAVLTPYAAQEQELRRRLQAWRVPLEQPQEDAPRELPGLGPPDLGVIVGTVHRFQGGERDVVLFSAVITEPKNLGFLNDRVNLVNVAVSRARRHFILVGHAPVLAQGPVTGVLVEAIAATARAPRDVS
jgi:hypothetical protein